ncbi:hypothetical protein C1645_878343 [Glomus cerebriforme]|uniref:TLDc domain-containing protein n=1 Tax=Glomus cerebriforme TaxID=658196 RepID=A0A397SSH1_9GLOM|nr:hypothetical protein C1645_878343 [Glomus cerebriforme]
MTLEYSQETINDYEKLFEADEEYDVIIITGFSEKWAEKKDGKFIFIMPNVSPQIFKIILRFIPQIRFYDIFPEDFISKVYPYKVLLPDDLVTNIFTFHMSDHFAIFASWIEKKNDSYYNVRNIPYSFNLLYRARYNPLFWDSSNNWKSTNDSFIFSFINRNNLQAVRVGYSNGNHSIGCHTQNGPIFGFNDLYKRTEGAWGCVSNHYPKLEGMPTGIFNVDDYEVFQVINNN